MLRYQYVMANTGAAQGDFLKTSMTWSNQVRILKQNFEALGSVVGGTLINVFKPIVSALNVVIGKFIEFAKVVSNSLGKIFGWQYQETGASGVATELENASEASDGVGSGLGKAADNAKKLKQQLQGFDELNVLTSDKPNSSSGGSGGSGGGGVSGGDSSGGQWTKTESIFKDYESSLDSLFKLGDYIGGTLTRVLNNIDWDSVYEGARNFGSGLASFLNGLISPDLFGALGKTVAGAINTAFQFLNSFGETFDWKDFGNSVMRGISDFFKTWDAKLTASALSNFASGIMQSITGFFNTLSDEKTFKAIGQKIVNLICNIKWGNLIWDFGNLVIALGKAIIDGLSDLADGMADEVTVIMEPVWESLEKWFADNFKFKTPELPRFDELQTKLKQVVDSVKNWWSQNAKLPSLSVTVSSIVDKLSSAWSSAVAWWNSKTSLSSISTTVLSIKDKLSSAWSTAVSWWSKKSALSKVSISIPNIKSNLSSAWNTAKNWWKKNVKLSIPKLTLKVEYKKPSGSIQKAVAKALNLKGWPALRFYASGGFPEDGWFRANHGELMGKFDNGRTVVANNKQITQGIADAVYQGNRENNALMRQELELIRRQNDLLADILEKETGISAGELFSSVRKSANDYSRRTGRPAFGY